MVAQVQQQLAQSQAELQSAKGQLEQTQVTLLTKTEDLILERQTSKSARRELEEAQQQVVLLQAGVLDTNDAALSPMISRDDAALEAQLKEVDQTLAVLRRELADERRAHAETQRREAAARAAAEQAAAHASPDDCHAGRVKEAEQVAICIEIGEFCIPNDEFCI